MPKYPKGKTNVTRSICFEGEKKKQGKEPLGQEAGGRTAKFQIPGSVSWFGFSHDPGLPLAARSLGCWTREGKQPLDTVTAFILAEQCQRLCRARYGINRGRCLRLYQVGEIPLHLRSGLWELESTAVLPSSSKWKHLGCSSVTRGAPSGACGRSPWSLGSSSAHSLAHLAV